MLYSNLEFTKRYVTAMESMTHESHLAFDVRIEDGNEGLVRASGVGNCARQQLLKLMGEPVTDPRRAQYDWSAWMGWYGQEVVAEIYRRMGYTVRIVSEVLKSDVMSGHTDLVMSGLDLGDDEVLVDVKLRNCYGYRQLITTPLIQADPAIYLQLQWYMQRLGLKRGMVSIHPHDYSSMKVEISRYKLTEKYGIVDPIVHRVFMQADLKAQQLAEDRAAALMAAKAMGLMVHREFNPTDAGDQRFPCGFCEWMQRCMMIDWERTVDNSEAVEVPPLPAEWKVTA